MDHSLWLLTRLRARALGRRWVKSLGRPQGVLVTIAFAVLFAPTVAGLVAVAVLGPRLVFPVDPAEVVERFGPIAFACLLGASLVGATREASLYYSPAEIDFLFPGPFRRRQLVAYKLTLTALASLVSALMIGLASRILATWFISGVVAATLAVVFIQLMQMALALTANLVGALIWGRGLRVVAVGLTVLATLAVLPSRDALRAADWAATALAVERAPATAVLLAPFRPFVYALTARSWPGLATWGGLSLVIDAALVALIFALDAGYLEAATVASGKRLAVAQKMVGAGGTFRVASRSTGRFRLRPPSPMWWGGVGPNLWRQTIGALGSPLKLAAILALVGGLGWFAGAALPRTPELADRLLPLGAGAVVPLTLFLSMILSFDFRGDLDVIETLKTLPIRPTRLALGQVLTPALLATAVQATAGLGLVVGLGWPRAASPLVASVLAFLPPANLFFFGVENLLFLWYPSRLVVGQFNGMAAARQMLLVLAKMLAIGLALALVGGTGGAAYALTGRPVPALATAWAALVVLTGALLPLLGRAFARFDVTLDIPA